MEIEVLQRVALLLGSSGYPPRVCTCVGQGGGCISNVWHDTVAALAESLKRLGRFFS
jgi:hypothetical protein